MSTPCPTCGAEAECVHSDGDDREWHLVNHCGVCGTLFKLDTQNDSPFSISVPGLVKLVRTLAKGYPEARDRWTGLADQLEAEIPDMTRAYTILKPDATQLLETIVMELRLLSAAQR